MTFLFWLFIALVAYVYAGYPLLIWLLSRMFRRPVRKGPYEPNISIIISAFNEESAIEQKLTNLLNTDYPEDKIEILVGSDGASDATDSIIAKFKSRRVRFFRFVENQGKPQVLNSLIKEAHGAILVFTDSRQEFERGAVRHLVENFHDGTVGCVSGELLFRDPKASGVGKGMDAYWHYEKFIRKCESDFDSMLGATGAIYAVRRRLFKKMPDDILVDDMYIPLAIVQRGFRAVFDPAAKAYDRVSHRGGEEFRRKVRTLTGNYQILQYFPELVVPFKSLVTWQFLSHKILRLWVPFFLAGILVTNLFLAGDPVYRWALLAQAIFYGLALFGAKRDRSDRKAARHFFAGRLSSIPYMFCLLNYAAFMSLFEYLKNKPRGAWEKAYQS